MGADLGKRSEHLSQAASSPDVHATDMQASFLASGVQGSHIEQIQADAPAEILEPSRLRTALEALARAHEVLRMSFDEGDDGRLRLVVAAQPKIDLRQLDWRGATNLPAMMAELSRQDRAEGADPRKGCGWRVTLIQLGGGQARLLWTIHHALIDGTSLEHVLTQLWSLLHNPSEPLEPSPSFLGLVAHWAQLDRTHAREFFINLMKAADDTALLRPRCERPPDMQRLATVIDAKTTAALQAVAAREGATVLNTVQAAWALVLSRWTGHPAAVMGLVDSGRSDNRFAAAVIGSVISTLPLLVDLRQTPDLGKLLSRLRRLTLEMRQHSHVGLSEIRRWTGRTGATPLFDTVLMFACETLAETLQRRGCGWTNVRLIECGDALVSLSVHGGPQLRLSLEHDATRLSGDDAARLLDHVSRLLTSISRAMGDCPLGKLEMLSPDETQALIRLGQPDRTVPDSTPCLATRFEQVAAAHPDRLAVIDAVQDRILSYRQLDRLANALAHRLADGGLAAGDVAAIAMPRGHAQIAAMLAVLKAGVAFLPLDPEQPAAYLADLVARTGARALIAPANSPVAGSAVLHLVPDDAEQDMPPQRPPPTPDRLAYLIHTSGSTGRPKAVMGLTGALVAHADAIMDRFGLQPGDRVLQFAALGFDVMLEEVWPTLLAGATVVTRDSRPLTSALGLLDLIAEHEISVINLPAGYWHQLVAAVAESGVLLPGALRLVVTGSERVSAGAYRRWRRLAPDIAFMNGYGPTEATITSTLWQAPPSGDGIGLKEDLPIGRALGHAHVVLRAPDGSLTPRQGQGALWIGGRAVTGGYLGDAEQTRRVFAPDPFHPGGRLYDSGDRAAWNDAGELIFLGRADRQLKLRGHRIDPAQIEAVLTDEPLISEVLVDVQPGPPDRLLAWVAVREPFDASAVMERLATRLPRYMQPVLVPVPSLPVTPNGKIDRAALPVPQPSDIGPVRRTGNEDPRALMIAACMAEVLECDDIPLDAAFDEIGGDSLLALRLVGLVKRRSGITLRTTDLLRHPSPQALVDMLNAGRTRPRYLVPIQTRGAGVPIIAVHVLGRNQELFRPLAAALEGVHPVYGLTTGIPDDLTKIDIRQTARLYLDELQDSLPDLPVCLLGVSMASYFAFELAQQLQGTGRKVVMLGVLDAMGPGGRPIVRGWARLQAHLRQLRLRGWRHLTDLLSRDGDDPDVPQPVLAHQENMPSMEQLIAANVAAVERYEAQPYFGDIVVYRADRTYWDTPEGLAMALGWAPVARGRLDLRDLPGTHLSILAEQNVDALANDLRVRLARD
ncbi:MAG: amino acid adenylation domain-containing protein [Paracoccus sp. (in: a-proteobacteria)]|nr:amino acid adenylation domain-containing protein [Paracoccus sp. (in: a-proteobacteria)]